MTVKIFPRRPATIAHHRRKESGPFLGPRRLRDWSRIHCLHATLRQGLFRFFSGAGRLRALLPDFAPEGISLPLLHANLQVATYPVAPDLSLPAGPLAAALAAHRPDVFIYIHHFGVYREDNLRLVRRLLPAGVLLVEDFAHSLPNPRVSITGDLALFSFSKLAGVPEGGLLYFKDRSLPIPGGYGPEGPARPLCHRLAANLALEDFFARWRAGTRLQTLLRRCLGGRADYYPYLLGHYRGISARVSAPCLRILESLDWEAIYLRRRALAEQYLQGLNPGFLLDVPPEACLRQALLAFPVLVDDQDRFHAHLAQRGVVGFRLTEGWWRGTGRPGPGLHRNHYLLPLGHHLEHADIARVVSVVNGYPGRPSQASAR